MTSQSIKSPLQSTKPHSQATKTTLQVNTVPPQPKTSSQPTKNSKGNKNKGNSNGCILARPEKCVKEAPVQEEDTDSHDSYESVEDELYRTPKVLGDNLYSSDSDDDSEKSAPKKNNKFEVREKHRPPKSRLEDKEIDTDNSSYEGFEDEQSSDFDVEGDDDDLDGALDADSWHSEDSGKELDSDEESPTVYPQFNENTKT